MHLELYIEDILKQRTFEKNINEIFDYLNSDFSFKRKRGIKKVKQILKSKEPFLIPVKIVKTLFINLSNKNTPKDEIVGILTLLEGIFIIQPSFKFIFKYDILFELLENDKEIIEDVLNLIQVLFLDELECNDKLLQSIKNLISKNKDLKEPCLKALAIYSQSTRNRREKRVVQIFDEDMERECQILWEKLVLQNEYKK